MRLLETRIIKNDCFKKRTCFRNGVIPTRKTFKLCEFRLKCYTREILLEHLSVAILELGPGRFYYQLSPPFQVRPVNRIYKKTFPSQRRCQKADPLSTPVPTPRLPPVASQLTALSTFPLLTLTQILPCYRYEPLVILPFCLPFSP